MQTIYLIGNCANMGGTEWILIVFIIALVFGAKRLPELARSMGKGLKEFKKATKELQEPVEDIKEPIEDVKRSINQEINRPPNQTSNTASQQRENSNPNHSSDS